MNETQIQMELPAILHPLVIADEFSGAVLVAQDQTILLQQAYGLASQRFLIPNQLDTRFNLGSNNKMFTGVAIVQLAEQEKLAFHDPISKYLPKYPRAIAEKVTIHHLLTHTSGLGNYWNERFAATWTRLRAVEDYLPLFRDDPLSFEPGERYQYSNAGFMVLGAIIEQVSGQDYFTYIREHISQPASMYNTDFYEMDRSVPNVAIGYTHLGLAGEPEAGARRNNFFQHTIKGGPAGGGFSTVEDQLKFSLALQNHLLLTPEFTEILLSGKVNMSRPGSKYAYGFGEEIVNGHRIVGHMGGGPGISARFAWYMDLGYTVVVLSNYDPPVANQIANAVQELLLRE